MSNKIPFYILMAVGVVGIIFVYSLRPPSGLGELASMAVQGRQFFLNEPVYYIGLCVFGLMALFGAVKAFR